MVFVLFLFFWLLRRLLVVCRGLGLRFWGFARLSLRLRVLLGRWRVELGRRRSLWLRLRNRRSRGSRLLGWCWRRPRGSWFLRRLRWIVRTRRCWRRGRLWLRRWRSVRLHRGLVCGGRPVVRIRRRNVGRRGRPCCGLVRRCRRPCRGRRGSVRGPGRVWSGRRSDIRVPWRWGRSGSSGGCRSDCWMRLDFPHRSGICRRGNPGHHRSRCQRGWGARGGGGHTTRSYYAGA